MSEVQAAAAAADKSFQVIIRGRMPIAAVALAKSIAGTEGNSDTVVANMFNTTTGKIHDIRTGRCFGYIDSEFKPTAEQVTEAKAWLSRHKDGAESDTVKSVVAKLEAMPVATVEEAAAFVAKRQGSRVASAPKLDAEGNPVAKAPRAKKEKKPKADKVGAADAAAAAGDDDTNVDDLLS